MYLSSFDGCCGIHIVISFGRTAAYNYKMSSDDISQETKELQRIVKQSKHIGCLVVALNENQINRGVEDVVLGAGFVKMGVRFNHPGHGHDIQMYQYVCNVEKAERTAPKTALRFSVGL